MRKKADFQFFSIFLFQTSTKTKIITFIVTQEKEKYPTIVINHLFIVLGWIWNRSVIHTDIVHECVYLAHTLLHIRALNVKSYEKFVQLVQDAEFDILFSSPCQTQTILFLVIWCWVFCKLAKIVKMSLVTRQNVGIHIHYDFIL